MTGAAQPAGPCVLVIFGAAGDLTDAYCCRHSTI